MRICSFLPSNTEILYQLGLGESVVGVTHECDYPPAAAEKPRVVTSFMKPSELTSAVIDTLVKENKAAGKSTYFVELDTLREARPDIIITQDLCEVCAVSGNEVVSAIGALDYTPEIVSLYPRSLGDILDSITRIGDATGTIARAWEVVEGLGARIDAIRSRFSGERDTARVLALEWLDPPFAGGHWVPEMIGLAGGEAGIVAPGEPSREISWDEVSELAPQVTVVMACGFDINRTMEEIDTITSNPQWMHTPAARKGQVYVTDANSYFSRPGPRIVDGLEILANILHPEAGDYSPPPDAVVNLRNYLYFQDTLG